MARLFDGIDDRIDLANEGNFDFTGVSTFSLACWLYLPTANSFGGILAKWPETAGGWEWILDDGQLMLEINGETNSAVVRTTADIPTGNWAHIATTYSGSGAASGITHYVNGAPVAMTTDLDAISGVVTNDVILRIGARETSGGAPTFFLTGSVSGVGIWNVVLAQADVDKLALGVNPIEVQNASLIASLPLCGVPVTEPDKKDTNNGTLAGTSIVQNPPLFRGCFAEVASYSMFPKAKLARV